MKFPILTCYYVKKAFDEAPLLFNFDTTVT
jgi:hypothetical protein